MCLTKSLYIQILISIIEYCFSSGTKEKSNGCNTTFTGTNYKIFFTHPRFLSMADDTFIVHLLPYALHFSDRNESNCTHKTRDDSEDSYHLRLGPATEFKMMMDRRHTEDALTMRQLEVSDLQNN